MKLKYHIFGAVLLLISCQKEVKTTDKEVVVETQRHSEGMATNLSVPDADVALNFINGYIANADKMGQAVGVVEWIAASPFATESYKAALKKEVEEAEMLDADPVFDAQDYDDTGMEAASVDKDGYVLLQGAKWKEFKVVVKLVKQEGKWLVDGCGSINIPENKRLLR